MTCHSYCQGNVSALMTVQGGYKLTLTIVVLEREKRLHVVNKYAFLSFTSSLLLTYWLQAQDGKQPQ